MRDLGRRWQGCGGARGQRQGEADRRERGASWTDPERVREPVHGLLQIAFVRVREGQGAVWEVIGKQESKQSGLAPGPRPGVTVGVRQEHLECANRKA